MHSRVPIYALNNQFFPVFLVAHASLVPFQNTKHSAFIEARVGCSSDSLESEPNITYPNSASYPHLTYSPPKKNLPGSTPSKNETSSGRVEVDYTICTAKRRILFIANCVIHCETWKNTTLNEVHGNKYICTCKADRPATISMIYWCVCRPGRGVKLKCMLLNPDRIRKHVFWTRVYLSYSHASVQPKKENKTQTVCCWHPLQVALFILYIMIVEW